MPELPESNNVDTAALAILRRLHPNEDKIDSEILFESSYNISGEEHREAYAIIAKSGGVHAAIDRMAVMTFWPMVIAILSYEYLRNELISMALFYVLMVLHFITRLIIRRRSINKVVTLRDYDFNPDRRIYLTRSAFAFRSDKSIFINEWKNYKEIILVRRMYMLVSMDANQMAIPVSTFASAEESEQFYEITKALIAGHPIDNLIKPTDSWPPKPTT
jgi:hypothetical protein